jgi:N-acetylneuraminic acid mutarotase
MSGSSTLVLMANGFGQPGVYGTLGVASSSNVPGGRLGAISWTDGSGNLWLFGGRGYDSTGTLGWLNDLWEFNPTAKTWTWMGGSDTGDASLYGTPGIYGTLGVSSPSNVPGDRDAPVSWIDGGGNLWLFGGWGFDSTGATGVLNDLWEFSPITKEWTWMGGSDTGDASGVYGTEGVPSTTNVPGARYLAISWTDSSGNFWLFGGTGQVANSNDLWEFNPTNKEWTWVSGSDTGDASGVYGTLGVAAASNVPGGRSSLVSWTDSSGNLWLFGGGGGPTGILNDLWEFSPITKEWTWMGGSDTGDASGVYGTLGVAAASNVPGGRWNPVGWIDGSGNLWLFGGQGLDSTGTGGWLNDLWEFSPTTKEWTWMGGSNTTYANATQYQPDRGQPGVYGTEGVPATTNVPGGRYSAVSWTDNSGNFWLFGGAGHDSTAAQIGGLNDLWRYQP